MRRSIMLGVVLAALSFAGCKKDKKPDEGAASGSAMAGSDTAGSSMAGSSMAGSGSSMAGSSMAGSSMAGSGSAAGSDTMAGSGSAAAGSGSAAAEGGGDPGCTKYAERFAACEKLDPKVKESMAKVFEGLKKAPTAKETCEKAAKGWDTTLTKAGC